MYLTTGIKKSLLYLNAQSVPRSKHTPYQL